MCACEAECVCPLFKERINHQGGSRFLKSGETRQRPQRHVLFTHVSLHFHLSPVLTCASAVPWTALLLFGFYCWEHKSIVKTEEQEEMLLGEVRTQRWGAEHCHTLPLCRAFYSSSVQLLCKDREELFMTLWRSYEQEKSPTSILKQMLYKTWISAPSAGHPLLPWGSKRKLIIS